MILELQGVQGEAVVGVACFVLFLFLILGWAGVILRDSLSLIK